MPSPPGKTSAFAIVIPAGISVLVHLVPHASASRYVAAACAGS